MNGVLLQDALLALLILSILCALLNQGMRVYEKASQIGIEAIDTQWFYDDGGADGALLQQGAFGVAGELGEG